MRAHWKNPYRRFNFCEHFEKIPTGVFKKIILRAFLLDNVFYFNILSIVFITNPYNKMNKFIASLIPSLEFWYLQYTWNKTHLKKTIDQSWALEWYNYNKEFLYEDQLTVNLFGNSITKKILFIKDWEYSEEQSLQDELNKTLKT